MDQLTNKRPIITSIIIASVLIAGAIISSKGDTRQSKDNNEIKDNLTISDGKQIIEIQAKGGYSPRKSVAKAGFPTILRMKTNGTFDCSSALRIQSMGINKNLPMSGVTDIDLGIPQAGTFRGTCAMGMYSFEIEFQN